MKKLRYSRLWWLLLLLLGGYASVWLRRYLPAEMAELLSDEFIAALGTALGLAATALKADDVRAYRRRVERRGKGAAVSVVLTALLGGCGAAALAWDRCEATIHPVERPAPAGRVDVRCQRSHVCREVVRTPATVECDGVAVVEREVPDGR